MISTYLGAVLFLVPALALAGREVVPVRHAESAGDMHGPPVPASSVVGRTRHFVPAVVASLVVGIAIIERWSTTTPAFATLMLVLLPVLTALAVIDLAVHRLPNRLTALLAALTVAGLAVVTLLTGYGANPMLDGDDTPSLDARRAVFGALALGASYLVLALLGGGSGMGLGDVKLAPSLGALTAWVGWDVWAAGALAAFLLGGAWGVVLMARGEGRHARMPFGPFMIVGAMGALVLA